MLKIRKRPRSAKPPSFLRRNASYLLFLICMAMLGFLAQFQWAGYVVIAIFTVYSFVRRLSSQLTFLLALLTLGVVPVAIILSNWLVAQNFAAYSFVLFVVGVVGLVTELQRSPRSETYNPQRRKEGRFDHMT